MAYEASQPLKVTLVSGEDLSAAQYHFVTLAADGTVELCDAETDVPIGVLQNNPGLDAECEITVIGVTKLIAGEDLDPLDIVGTNASGRGQVVVPGTDITVYSVGQVLATGSSADGTVATVVVNCASPARAA